jgi:ribonuclease HII
MPHYRFERRQGAGHGGGRPVAGIDEAGRGPLAGPVAAAAVVLDPENLPRGLDDSKALDAATRERLADVIFAKAVAVSVCFASVAEIDRFNIRGATHLAMRRAAFGLTVQPVHILVDGNDCPKGLPCDAQALVGGDARSMSIAAASILAKVMRDRLMRRLAVAHPGYGFERHVGYGTPAHLAALDRLGPCVLHRRGFAPVREKQLALAI